MTRRNSHGRVFAKAVRERQFAVVTLRVSTSISLFRFDHLGIAKGDTQTGDVHSPDGRREDIGSIGVLSNPSTGISWPAINYPQPDLDHNDLGPGIEAL